MNPRELLPDYVLGLLSKEEKLEVETYLASSSTAQQELANLQKTLVKLTESIPGQSPQSSFRNIQQRLRQPAKPLEASTPRYSGSNRWSKQLREWRNYALTASVALAIIGFAWALQLKKQLTQTYAEQNKVNYWLTHDNLRAFNLSPIVQDPNLKSYGSLILLEDGRCLFVLKENPPAGKSYQVWGQKNGESFSLAVSQVKLIEVKYTDYEVIGVSLEPYGGSPAPTQPLSRVATW
jgi:anti-sigma-K factor RskA